MGTKQKQRSGQEARDKQKTTDSQGSTRATETEEEVVFVLHKASLVELSSDDEELLQEYSMYMYHACLYIS